MQESAVSPQSPGSPGIHVGRNGTVTEYDRPLRADWKLLAQLRVNEPFRSMADCARALGVSSATVSHWVKKPEYQRYENFLIHGRYENELASAPPADRKKIQENFSEYAEYMQERLLAILDSTPNEKLQADIAKDWLDRAGHQVQRMETRSNVSVVLTPETIAMLRQRASELSETTYGEVPLQQAPSSPQTSATIEDVDK